jgi:hypothetical protein
MPTVREGCRAPAILSTRHGGDGDARGFASGGEGRLVALDEHAGALAVTAIGAVLFWAAL